MRTREASLAGESYIGTVTKSDAGLFSITRSLKCDVLHMVTKTSKPSHFTIKSSRMCFVVAEKSEAQVHCLV